MANSDADADGAPPPRGDRSVIDLSRAAGQRESWDRPRLMVYLWSVAELLFVYNPWQISSALRAATLRRFGAIVGHGVVLRPRMRVRFPWKLSIGARTWIGEDVWIHNQARVTIGADAVISQGTFITTGSHAYRTDMRLLTRDVAIGSGAWVTARCVVLAGSTIGDNALITPGTVVRGDVPAGAIFGAPEGRVLGPRFPEGHEDLT
jgi:putative colanic acid biosynthesis acetyltransferase WcaF